MARNRMINFRIWSEELIELSSPAKLLYLFACHLADDNGCWEYRPKRAISLACPEAIDKAEPMKNELIEAGLWIFYDVEDKYFVFMPEFIRFQSPSFPKQMCALPPENVLSQLGLHIKKAFLVKQNKGRDSYEIDKICVGNKPSKKALLASSTPALASATPALASSTPALAQLYTKEEQEQEQVQQQIQIKTEDEEQEQQNFSSSQLFSEEVFRKKEQEFIDAVFKYYKIKIESLSTKERETFRGNSKLWHENILLALENDKNNEWITNGGCKHPVGYFLNGFDIMAHARQKPNNDYGVDFNQGLDPETGEPLY